MFVFTRALFGWQLLSASTELLCKAIVSNVFNSSFTSCNGFSEEIEPNLVLTGFLIKLS